MEKINFPHCRSCGNGKAASGVKRAHGFCRLCGMGVADGNKEFCCRECRKRWCKWNSRPRRLKP
ncbi:hypothetical protein COU39_01875 [Candidatus Micrarchaeota archaeon CG10_big_fil_rev_8_21_14_0_10_60_32]|nr:MAG: hypothetical protein AUJ16_02720 [Candidatus Micrarchaeota archaeon CG1_02_60_51]PIN96309.1 MAG: hypothetical protein COU39_01875 [Candidatus Micrarchaeota archaeon CG10_big_fil_rev_8_21_14_0_10_60_32]